MDGARLKQASEFKYLGCVLAKQIHMLPSVIGKWRVGGKLRLLSSP